MKKEEQKLTDFLLENDFRIINSDISDYFGDYFKTYSNNIFDLRFAVDKSNLSVDVKNDLSIDDWYDLSLVRTLIYNEEVFNQISSIDDVISFLKNEMATLKKLFEENNYPDTIMKLEDLGNKRAKLMFPDL